MHCTSLFGVGAGQSVDQHLLSSYHYALLAVILAQFTCKGFSDGMEGIVRAVETSPRFQVNLQHTKSMYSYVYDT